MISYLALLRGINVGGNNMIKMAELKERMTAAGFVNVRTYIQSGNILFDAAPTKPTVLAAKLQAFIVQEFGLTVPVVVFSEAEWRAIIAAAPQSWGVEATSRHNIWVLLHDVDVQAAMTAIGELKPGIELLVPGNGVLYQSAAVATIGRATTGSKVVAKPIYKQLTIRNFNTATKLLDLL